jgi:hypothetical protein
MIAYRTLAAALICIAALAAQATPLPAAAPGDGSYFPIVEGAEYTYKGTFNNNTYTEKVFVRKASRGGVTAYYFAKQDAKTGGDTLLLAGNMIGHGLYFKTDKTLNTVDAPFTRDAENSLGGKQQTMFTFPLAKGGTHAAAVGKGTWTYTVVGQEDVTVLAGTYKGCMKIKIDEVWPDKKYEGYAWLAKDVGLVKWQRSTGRIDELVSVKLPPK